MFWQGQCTAHRVEQVEVNSPAVHSRQWASSRQAGCTQGAKHGLQLKWVLSSARQLWALGASNIKKHYTELSRWGLLTTPEGRSIEKLAVNAKTLALRQVFWIATSRETDFSDPLQKYTHIFIYIQVDSYDWQVGMLLFGKWPSLIYLPACSSSVSCFFNN